jgi:hypothetical protein
VAVVTKDGIPKIFGIGITVAGQQRFSTAFPFPALFKKMKASEIACIYNEINFLRPLRN